ncbi:hypothetical protein DB41_FC00010, partial [Neochlamydia sp. TUME1]|uniref:hypothetical protein n=1 Tax=Neochlamydia sp. TUME1 TaxID=1478174 RepID=UPI0005807D95
SMQLKVVCNLCLNHRLLGAFPNLLYSIFNPRLACQSSWRTIIRIAFTHYAPPFFEFAFILSKRGVWGHLLRDDRKLLP